MLLKDFIKQLQTIYDQSKGTHHVDEPEVKFYLDDDKVDVECVSVEPDRMWGCECWIGADVTLKSNAQGGKNG